jgi:hypothetical protein
MNVEPKHSTSPANYKLRSAERTGQWMSKLTLRSEWEMNATTMSMITPINHPLLLLQRPAQGTDVGACLAMSLPPSRPNRVPPQECPLRWG